MVPSERLSDLYRLAAEWSAPPAPPTEAVESSDAPSHAWRPGDEDLAHQVVLAGNDNARAIYRVLAEHAGSAVDFRDLDAAAGMDGLRRAGLLGAMGRTCWHRGREVPWTWDSDRHTYTMSASVAEMFLAALNRL
jgi:hypothetical protein